MSQLLVRLRRELDQKVDPIERAETVARIAGVLVRVGLFEEAKGAISAIREQFGRGQSGRVTVWLMLAEGLILHYQDLSPSAIDRISRAQLLGLAMKYNAIVALSSAWKAHIEFERSDFISMVRSIDLTLKNIDDDDCDAQTRLAIVLSNSFMICGDRQQSDLWFRRGHNFAIRNGDQTSVDALVYNRAAFILAWFRALSCVQCLSSEEVSRIRSEVESAKNLQNLTGVTALSSHIRLLDMRLMLLERRFDEVVRGLQDIRNAVPFAPHNFDQSFIDLEMRFAGYMLGEVGIDDAGRASCEPVDFERLDIDEQIVAAYMFEQMSTMSTHLGDPAVHRERLKRLWSRYSEERSSLRVALEPFELR